MRASRRWLWLGVAALVAGAVACSLNPQPLPPEAPADGINGDASVMQDGGGSTSSPDAAFVGDAGALDAGADNTVPVPPPGDGGTPSHDAGPQDGGDADVDASDAAADVDVDAAADAPLD